MAKRKGTAENRRELYDVKGDRNGGADTSGIQGARSVRTQRRTCKKGAATLGQTGQLGELHLLCILSICSAGGCHLNHSPRYVKRI